MEVPRGISTFPDMGRLHRSHLPGGTLHLTTRLLRGEALFEAELKYAIIALLRDQVAIGDVELLAYAIMSNHLHLIVRQGNQPLCDFMQPLLRRIALLVQRKHNYVGCIFERRYRDRPCADPDYLRNAIAYTHLNPVRAGLCTRAEEYEWSSHRAWLGETLSADGGPEPVTPARVLPLFARSPERSRSELIADYVAYLDWRLASDRWQADVDMGRETGCSPPPPPLAQGDANWRSFLSVHQPGFGFSRPLASGEPIAGEMDPRRLDLGVIAAKVLNESEPGLDPLVVRSRWGGRPYVLARHTIIRRAVNQGYRNTQIAAYLRVSANAVSNVIAADRKRLLVAGPTLAGPA